jgi:hypothetical protein
MRRHPLLTTLTFGSLLFAACGDDGGGGTPDAPPDPPDPDAPLAAVCGTPDGTISTYPGTFSGDTTGAGADLTVAEGACATENLWFDPVGEDQVVALEGLTPNALYVVDLNSTVADLSFYVAEMCDAAGPTAGACLLFSDATVAGTSELFAFRAPASGRAAVIVDSYDAAEIGAYTLMVSPGECLVDGDCTAGGTPRCGPTFTCVQCANDFDCAGTTGTPTCDAAVGSCVAGPAMCVGDDPADDAGGDDGPGGARVLTGMTQTFTGSVCNEPANESDFFRIDIPTGGEGITINLDFANTLDLDAYMFNANGIVTGISWWVDPEIVTLTYLPAGTYYLRVNLFADPPTTTAAAYTVQISRTAAQTCTTNADCAAEFETQVYRGNCTGGSCDFIPAGQGAPNSPCDSNDDCGSGTCSYILFDADAQDSVCSGACTMTTDCAAIGAGLTCTTGFGTNICVPSCANNLQCGANIGSGTLDAGQPWDYLTCTVATGVCGFP